jgi:oxygen-independent coproporphyrinogen-3 oxidase
MVNNLRGLGFDSFNFDLVYGLPGQTVGGWQNTLEKVHSLEPNRLAVYSYAHVPWIRPVQRSFADSDLPAASMKIELFGMAVEFFTNQGYRLIGIDHFAREGDELGRALDDGSIHRNFMGYSTKADAHQIGLGMSAISFAGGNYFQNEKDLKKYCQKRETGHLATFRGKILAPEDAIRRDFIMQFMCQGRVNLREFEKKWDISFDQHFKKEKSALMGFADDQLLIVTPDEMRATSIGTLFLRNMASLFDAYMEGVKKEAKTPVFSRAV